jgi:ABC-type phosphate/phosphonate transport system substrate-binding protein
MRKTTSEHRTIRVLVDGANWLAEAVEKILSGHADMKLIGPSARTLALVRRSRRADVVVTSLADTAGRQKYQRMFFGRSGVPIVAISRDRKRVEVYDRGLVRQVDFPHLATAIREVAQHRGARVPPPASE